MAEGGDDQERSEDPTQKRLDDAVKKGDVAKSQEVNTWFLLAGGTFALYSFGGYSAEKLARAFSHIFSHAHAYGMDGRAIVRLAKANGYSFMKVYTNLSAVAFAGLAVEASRRGLGDGGA